MDIYVQELHLSHILVQSLHLLLLSSSHIEMCGYFFVVTLSQKR